MTEQLKKLKTNLTQSQLDQIAELITFVEDEDGKLYIDDVRGDIFGDVLGDVGGKVRGDVGGDVGGDVLGSIKGSVYGNVKGNVYSII